MSEWLDNQKKLSSNFRRFSQKQIRKFDPRRKLIANKNKCLSKLKVIFVKLNCRESGQNLGGKNVQCGVWLLSFTVCKPAR